MISKEQFIRGFNALKANSHLRRAVGDAARDAGLQDFDLGCNPLEHELQTLLGELCRVREDDDGPWPTSSWGNDDLELALHYAEMGNIRDENGNKMDFPSTAEGLWRFWEHTGTGPFRPPLTCEPGRQADHGTIMEPHPTGFYLRLPGRETLL